MFNNNILILLIGLKSQEKLRTVINFLHCMIMVIHHSITTMKVQQIWHYAVCWRFTCKEIVLPLMKHSVLQLYIEKNGNVMITVKTQYKKRLMLAMGHTILQSQNHQLLKDQEKRLIYQNPLNLTAEDKILHK